MLDIYMIIILTTIILITLLISVGYLSGKIVSFIIIKGYRLFKNK